MCLNSYGEVVSQPLPAADQRTLLSRDFILTTIGTFSLIFLAAFESLAVTTVMPGISRELDGAHLYAISFAAPLATGIVGMVAAGLWSDRRGPAQPLIGLVAIFALGLIVCGLAPTMEVLVLGRLVQGFGGGGSIVAIYVLVGVVYPGWLQPRVFASFAAAWVFPSLFGPPIAALIAERFGWQWVFLSAVGLALLALALCWPVLGTVSAPSSERADGGLIALAWASLAAAGVLGLDFSGRAGEAAVVVGVVAAAATILAVRPLVPRGTLRARRGLPSTILTRGALSAAFFTIEAYIPFVLQDRWHYSPTQAGMALTVAGVSWASASQLQGRLGERLSNTRAMVIGSALAATGGVIVILATYADWSGLVVIGGYGVTSVGMGLGYARTTVAMLGASSDADRGFNSSALTIADSLAAALAVTLGGLAFALSERTEWGDPFGAVFVVGTICAILAIASARRTQALPT